MGLDYGGLTHNGVGGHISWKVVEAGLVREYHRSPFLDSILLGVNVLLSAAGWLAHFSGSLGVPNSGCSNHRLSGCSRP
jgi:hypothetical protein